MTTANAGPGPKLIRLGDTDRVIPVPDEDVRGRKVVDRAGEELGKVSDLLVDDTASHVRFLIVQHGGVLGFGAEESFIPVEAIADIQTEVVLVDSDFDTVVGAPQYDPDIAIKDSYVEDVYGYYGFTPYWAPGSRPSGFPYFGHRG